MSTAPTPSLEGPTVEGLMKLIEDYGNDCYGEANGTDALLAAIRAYAASLTAKPAPARQPTTAEWHALLHEAAGALRALRHNPGSPNFRKWEDDVLPKLDAAAIEAECAEPAVAPTPLTVWYRAMPESNGRTNWTATLHRDDLHEGFTLARSEYPHHVAPVHADEQTDKRLRP